jgi:aromatic-amino-acid transaminase
MRRREMMTNNMVADHARWPAKDDPIFTIAGKAQEAEKQFGAENVINSTLGALMDDQGKLVAFKSVYDVFKQQPDEELAAYSAIPGMPRFLEAVEKSFFKEYRPEAYIRTIATPGGTGAVKHAVWNYTNSGDEILTSDWYWTPYQTIAEEGGRNIATYELFDSQGNYNVSGFKKRFKELIDKQKRLLTIINTPAHNPTGYSVSNEEWDDIIGFLKVEAMDHEKRIIVLVDAAYIDFAGVSDERREFLKKFSNLPDNIFIIAAFSASKGFTMYGLRNGAAIGISSSQEIVDEFFSACLHSGRATWSNGTRGAMLTVADIIGNQEKYQRYIEEKTFFNNMLRRRAEAFVKRAEEIGLKLVPYSDGFFISLPCDKPFDVSKALMEENLFVVPLAKGLRFAVCSVSEEKCLKAPDIIKRCIDSNA